MKILLLITIFLFQTDSIQTLKQAYYNLETENSRKNQENYLKAFPDNFSEFNAMFGFDEKPAPLYNESYDYIQKIFHLDKISKEEKFNKWINISVNGKWDADAVNYFQYGLIEKVLQNIDLTHKVLKERSDADIESFFIFFFNRPHPWLEVPKEFESLKSDKKFYNLIKKALEKVRE